MDGVSEAPARSTVPAWAKRRLFDVAEYHRMGEIGILHEDDPFELIEGELIEMSGIGTPHIGAVMALTQGFALPAAGRALVSVQNPLRLDFRNEPEPDVVLLRLRADGYRSEPPPMPADAFLVIEVADSSLRYDTEVKRPLYAKHGVSELWIVDLDAGEIEVCRAPVDGVYTDVTRAARGRTVAPLALPDAGIAVADVVPPEEK
jgi:Uma2 family endonuclease